jgi:hypothetical protein
MAQEDGQCYLMASNCLRMSSLLKGSKMLRKSRRNQDRKPLLTSRKALSALLATIAALLFAASDRGLAKDETSNSLEDRETESLLKLAQSELAAKRYLNVMIHVDRVIEHHPENQTAHYYRALALHYLRNAQAARAEYILAATGPNTVVAKRAQAGLAALGGKSTAIAEKPGKGGGKSMEPKSLPGQEKTDSNARATLTMDAPHGTFIMVLSDDAMSNELQTVYKDLERAYHGKIRFEQYRFEDTKNKPLLEKYNIEDAPIAVFLNREGHTVDRMEDFVDCRPTLKEKLNALLN